MDATASLQGALGWLKYTIDTELRMNEIAEASKRISALLAGAKQYSQMDRGAYHNADVHELLRSTIMMFGDQIGHQGKGRPITLVKDTDRSLPELLCYPGDLNQVWTNLIDNAIQAMNGHGTLTIRTARENEDMIRVEICDDGPGIPRTSSTASSRRSSPPSRSARAPDSAWTWRGASSSRSTTATCRCRASRATPGSS